MNEENDKPRTASHGSRLRHGRVLHAEGGIDAIMGNPPLGGETLPLGEEPWRKIGPETIGIRCRENLIQAWSVREGASVEVRSERVCGEGEPSACWNLVATVDCDKVMIATIFGGRNLAGNVCKKLRNALLAARLKGKRHRMNCQARAAAAASVKHEQEAGECAK